MTPSHADSRGPSTRDIANLVKVVEQLYCAKGELVSRYRFGQACVQNLEQAGRLLKPDC